MPRLTISQPGAASTSPLVGSYFVATAIFGALAASSCSVAPASEASDTTNAHLTASDLSPGEPPAVSVDGVRLLPLNVDWTTPETLERVSSVPDNSTLATDLPMVALEGEVRFEIAASELPALVEVVTFDALEGGVPVGSGETVQCATDSSCEVSKVAEGVLVKLRMDQGVEVAIISLFYDVETVDELGSRAVGLNYTSAGAQASR